ncbi:hypothetical protein GJ496_003552 [Pomphorhynchus laevis]|nr:hypothetical protein GJ496_003552 [Pomphorhynchus laevis]
MQINTHATIKSVKNNNATIATISTTASSHIGCSGNNASLSSRIIAAANCHHQQQPDVVPGTPSLTSYKHILATAVPANIQASAFTTSLPPPQLSSLSTSSSSKSSLPSTKAKPSSLLSIPQQSELFSLMEQQFLPNMITNDNGINSINDRNIYPNLNVFLDLETRQVLVPSTSNDGNMVLVPMQIPFQNSALRLALATSDSTVSDASCLNSPCSLASTKASTIPKPITTSSSPSYITTNDSNSIDNVVAGDSVNINDINKLTTTIGTVDNINLGNSGCKTKTLAQIKRQIAEKRLKKKCLARAANSTPSNYLSDHNSSGTNLNNLVEVQDHYLDVRELNNASSSISELDPFESTTGQFFFNLIL